MKFTGGSPRRWRNKRMGNYEKLVQAGINIDTLMNRLMGNTSLIKLLVSKFTADRNFADLSEAFDAGDMQAAERASHTLKGMCGNMSLDALFALFTEQVNLIRTGEGHRAAAMMPEISVAYERAVTCMCEWVAEN